MRAREIASLQRESTPRQHTCLEMRARRSSKVSCVLSGGRSSTTWRGAIAGTQGVRLPHSACCKIGPSRARIRQQCARGRGRRNVREKGGERDAIYRISHLGTRRYSAFGIVLGFTVKIYPGWVTMRI
jgi:hypothetical protein